MILIAKEKWWFISNETNQICIQLTTYAYLHALAFIWLYFISLLSWSVCILPRILLVLHPYYAKHSDEKKKKFF